MQIYVDMDGVLADFDQHYEDLFGVRPDKTIENVDWKKVAETKDFYLNIPPMKDMWELWGFVSMCSLSLNGKNPIILTGIPYSIAEAEANKQAWKEKTFIPAVEMICCPSKEKYKYCKPGDLLIDDWTKYKHLWEGAGGRWITHTSAENTIKQLRQMLFPQTVWGGH